MMLPPMKSLMFLGLLYAVIGASLNMFFRSGFIWSMFHLDLIILETGGAEWLKVVTKGMRFEGDFSVSFNVSSRVLLLALVNSSSNVFSLYPLTKNFFFKSELCFLRNGSMEEL